jgi:DNA-binding transcriptional regulator YiaG
LQELVPLPDTREFPNELKTIGDHLKKARLERKMLIKDVLEILGVNRWTLRQWEQNILEPFVYQYPKIIAFLGYYPFTHETETQGGKIKKYRFTQGLSMQEFGKLVGVAGCTVSTWERNKAKAASQEKSVKLNTLLNTIR